MIIRVQITIFGKKWVKMKKVYLSLFVMLLIILPGCSKKHTQNNVKIVTLNVRYDNPNDSVFSWPRRASQVCDFILTDKPDIIGLQGVLWHQYIVLETILLDYSSIGAGCVDGAKEGEMNPVFFRKEKFSMIRNITFWLSDSPEVPGTAGWGSSRPRIVTWTELVDKKSHKHFFFFNTHFSHNSDSARVMSSKMLLKEVNKIADGFPFVITGDFNLSPTSKGYATLTGPNESVPLLNDSYVITEKGPIGPPNTFNGFFDNSKTARTDYIFVKNGMKVLNYETIIKKEKEIYISDHWPVQAIISID
jgi:endonuclease/exonuclease/phosphatase family metal-dependent hydrolase